MQEGRAKPTIREPAPEAATRDDVRVAASPLRCPFCHADVVPEAADWVACKSCLARHHAGCWKEASGCSTCRGTLALPASEARSCLPTATPPASTATGSAGAGNFLRRRLARVVVAAAVLVSCTLAGVTSFQVARRSAQRRAIRDLLGAAADGTRSLAARRVLVTQVLSLEADNDEARALLKAMETEQAEAEAIRAATERAEAERLRAEAERLRAEAERLRAKEERAKEERAKAERAKEERAKEAAAETKAATGTDETVNDVITRQNLRVGDVVQIGFRVGRITELTPTKVVLRERKNDAWGDSFLYARPLETQLRRVE